MPGALRAECSNIAVCGIVGAVVRELLRAFRDDRLTVTMKPEVARAAFGPFGEQHQDTDAFFSAGSTFICNLFFATGGAPATFATRCSQDV